MRMRKNILKVLLIAFVFVAMHDFIMVYVDSDTQVELCLKKVEKIDLCNTSVIHELVHQSLVNIDQAPPISYYEHLKLWVSYETDDSLSSLLQYKIYRPPIV